VNQVLIVFAKCPDPGSCKTRLIPAIGVAGAVQMHRHLLCQTLRTAADCQPLCRVQVYYTGQAVTELSREVQMLCPTAELFPQGEGDLGVRLQRATREAFRSGASSVVVIGTDCPALSAQHVAEAVDQLRIRDTVLGPAVDGGYYLIGLSQNLPELFENIDWSTSAVLAQTLEHAHKLELDVGHLAKLADVDLPEDLTPELLQSAGIDLTSTLNHAMPPVAK
jgi:rSAM/selenodomain-associated transferase 1